MSFGGVPRSATQRDSNDWTALIDEQTLTKQREAGYFLDFWHWRAHRSNPPDVSGDQYVAEYRPILRI